MAIHCLLLRFVLSVLLIANGAGAARAEVRMHLPAVPDAAGGLAAAGRTSPCHGLAMSMQSRVEKSRSRVDTAERGGAIEKHQRGDCCKGGLCSCDGMQAASFATPSAVTDALAFGLDRFGAFATNQRLAPILPHAIRPPIG